MRRARPHVVACSAAALASIVLAGCGGDDANGSVVAQTGAAAGGRYDATYEVADAMAAQGIVCLEEGYYRGDHQSSCVLSGRVPVEDDSEKTEWWVWPDGETEIEGVTVDERTDGLAECRSIVGENWIVELGRDENLETVLAAVGGRPFGEDCDS